MAIINDPSAYFQTTLYTGDGGGTRTVTNGGNSDLSPNWVWIKDRGTTSDHYLFDSVRGVTKHIESNNNSAQATDANSLKSFNSDGFTVGTSGNVNGNSRNFVSWNWKETNSSAGFDIVAYTGNGSSGRTVSHNLNAVPKTIIIKDLSASTDWTVYHEGIGNTKRMVLNTATAAEDDSSFFNDTTPTSSVFTLGSSSAVNLNGRDYIAYVFTDKNSFSKFGRFTANGSADNVFVYTGFKVGWVMMKCDNVTDGWSKWYMFDTARSPNNMNVKELEANNTTVESGNGSDYAQIDMYSNGFKLRNGSAWGPASNGNTSIYMAFAQNPFVTATDIGSIPATAR